MHWMLISGSTSWWYEEISVCSRWNPRSADTCWWLWLQRNSFAFYARNILRIHKRCATKTCTIRRWTLLNHICLKNLHQYRIQCIWDQIGTKLRIKSFPLFSILKTSKNSNHRKYWWNFNTDKLFKLFNRITTCKVNWDYKILFVDKNLIPKFLLIKVMCQIAYLLFKKTTYRSK